MLLVDLFKKMFVRRAANRTSQELTKFLVDGEEDIITVEEAVRRWGSGSITSLEGAMPTYNDVIDRDGSRWSPHYNNSLKCTCYVRTMAEPEQRNTVELRHEERSPHDGRAWFSYSLHLGQYHPGVSFDVHPKDRTDKEHPAFNVVELKPEETILSLDELVERYPPPAEHA